MSPGEEWAGIDFGSGESECFTFDPLLAAWSFDELEVKPEERERYRQWKERHVQPDENLRGTGSVLLLRAADWEKEGKP